MARRQPGRQLAGRSRHAIEGQGVKDGWEQCCLPAYLGLSVCLSACLVARQVAHRGASQRNDSIMPPTYYIDWGQSASQAMSAPSCQAPCLSSLAASSDMP